MEITSSQGEEAPFNAADWHYMDVVDKLRSDAHANNDKHGLGKLAEQMNFIDTANMSPSDMLDIIHAYKNANPNLNSTSDEIIDTVQKNLAVFIPNSNVIAFNKDAMKQQAITADMAEVILAHELGHRYLEKIDPNIDGTKAEWNSDYIAAIITGPEKTVAMLANMAITKPGTNIIVSDIQQAIQDPDGHGTAYERAKFLQTKFPGLDISSVPKPVTPIYVQEKMDPIATQPRI